MIPDHVKLPVVVLAQLLDRTSPLWHRWTLNSDGLNYCQLCGLLRRPDTANQLCRRNGG